MKNGSLHINREYILQSLVEPYFTEREQLYLKFDAVSIRKNKFVLIWKGKDMAYIDIPLTNAKSGDTLTVYLEGRQKVDLEV